MEIDGATQSLVQLLLWRASSADTPAFYAMGGTGPILSPLTLKQATIRRAYHRSLGDFSLSKRNTDPAEWYPRRSRRFSMAAIRSNPSA
jgi:hypothetical protein